ncbi:MAG: 6-bladed beta-propeller [Bacteroidaceae bacterium]|nr:6-bladed beta-propeller [Bacteroidaceae bacterium]
MKKSIYILLIITAVFASSCKKKNETTAEIVVTDIPAKEYLLTDIATDIEIITLHSNEPLDEFGNIKIIDNNLFALNSDNNILYHFVDGQLKQTLNKVGRGPGEYFVIDLYDYDPVKGLVYISDRDDRELLVYDANNNFEHVRTIKINQSQTLPIMALLDSDHLMHVASPNTEGAFASMKILNLQDLSIDSICGFNQNVKLNSTITMDRCSNKDKLFGINDHVSYIYRYVQRNGKYCIDTLYSVQMGENYDIPYNIANADTRTDDGYWTFYNYQEAVTTLPSSITQQTDGFAFGYGSTSLSYIPEYKLKNGVYIYKYNDNDINVSKLKVPGIKRNFLSTFHDDEHYYTWFCNTYENVETIIDPNEELCPLAVDILRSIVTDKTVCALMVSYKLK